MSIFNMPYDTEVLLFFNSASSPVLDTIATTLTAGIAWIPLYLALLYIIIKNSDTMTQIALVLLAVGLCLLLTAGVNNLVLKPYFARLRPINDPDVRPLLFIAKGMATNTYSFFSSHASNTMGVAVFFSLLIRNWRMAVVMITYSLINCWTRLYLGMHYPSDIIAGMLWGFLAAEVSYCLYRIAYKHTTSKLRFISGHYSSTGFLLTDVNIIINVVLLTLIATFFYSLI